MTALLSENCTIQVAFSEGRTVGLQGNPQAWCPFDPGTELYASWVRGWKVGLAEFRARMTPPNSNASWVAADRLCDQLAIARQEQIGERPVLIEDAWTDTPQCPRGPRPMEEA